MPTAVPSPSSTFHLTVGKRLWIGLLFASTAGLVSACGDSVGEQAIAPQVAAASLNELLANTRPKEIFHASIKDCTLTIKMNYPVQCVSGDDITLKGKVVTLNLKEFRPTAQPMPGLVEPDVSHVQIWPSSDYQRLFKSAQDAAFAAGSGNYELSNEQRRSVVSERAIEILEAAGAVSRTEIKMCSGSSYLGSPTVNEMRLRTAPSMANDLSAKLESYIRTYCGAE